MREEAAKAALADIRFLLGTSEQPGDLPDAQESYLDGPLVVELLEKNFRRLDPDNNGISRQELMSALTRPDSFSPDEYEMLRLVTKYFDTIINMSDDNDGKDGEELRITGLDLSVLKQFLVTGQVTLRELHRWCSTVEFEVGLPPLSSDG